MNEFTKVFAKTIEDEAIKQIEVLSNSDAYSGCECQIVTQVKAVLLAR